MIQEILVLIIIGAVILKISYSVYKSVITKDKSLCGGCGSCDIKSELKKNVFHVRQSSSELDFAEHEKRLMKKKGKLIIQNESGRDQTLQFNANMVKYIHKRPNSIIHQTDQP